MEYEELEKDFNEAIDDLNSLFEAGKPNLDEVIKANKEVIETGYDLINDPSFLEQEADIVNAYVNKYISYLEYNLSLYKQYSVKNEAIMNEEIKESKEKGTPVSIIGKIFTNFKLMKANLKLSKTLLEIKSLKQKHFSLSEKEEQSYNEKIESYKYQNKLKAARIGILATIGTASNLTLLAVRLTTGILGAVIPPIKINKDLELSFSLINEPIKKLQNKINRSL